MTSPSFAKMHILSILFLATRRDPRKFPASTAVAVLAFPSSYLKVPIEMLRTRMGVAHPHCDKKIIILAKSLLVTNDVRGAGLFQALTQM